MSSSLCHHRAIEPSPVSRGGSGSALGSFPWVGRAFGSAAAVPWVTVPCPHVCPRGSAGSARGREPHFPSAGWESWPGHPGLVLGILVRAGWGHPGGSASCRLSPPRAPGGVTAGAGREQDRGCCFVLLGATPGGHGGVPRVTWDWQGGVPRVTPVRQGGVPAVTRSCREGHSLE